MPTWAGVTIWALAVAVFGLLGLWLTAAAAARRARLERDEWRDTARHWRREYSSFVGARVQDLVNVAEGLEPDALLENKS